MGELVIQYHDFENAKKEIKKFSEQTITDLELKRVNHTKDVGEFLGDWFLGGGIGLDHKVTGWELNNLTSQIQTHLHSINNTQIKLIKEFGQIYSALEALDNDYIQTLLVSIKSTEETSEGIQKTQEQIKKIVENQRKTLEELKKFKQKLDGYAHLEDIDKIWGDCQKWHQNMTFLTKEISMATEHSKENIKNIDALRTALTVAEKKTGDLSTQILGMIESLESVIAFTSTLEKITYLQDIDEMWESLSTVQDSLKNISSDIEGIRKIAIKHQGEINKLLVLVERVSSLEHLMDVDSTWNTVREHSGQLCEMERQNEAIATSVQKNKEDVEAKIVVAIQENNNAIESLIKKIKYAYLIAGGAAGLAIIELVLLLR